MLTTLNASCLCTVLDAQSDACFVSESTCKILTVHGRHTKLELSTMTGRSIIDSHVIEGLVIQPLAEDEVIKILSAYIRPALREKYTRK